MRRILILISLASGLVTAAAAAQSDRQGGPSDVLLGIVWLIPLGVVLGFFLGVIWGLGQGDHSTGLQRSKAGARSALTGRRPA